jgi:uncharacterized membrane protein YeaQ/YmgE (transglycosylase-associated protein family)
MTDDVQYHPPGSEFKLAKEAAAMKAYNQDQARQAAMRWVRTSYVESRLHSMLRGLGLLPHDGCDRVAGGTALLLLASKARLRRRRGAPWTSAAKGFCPRFAAVRMLDFALSPAAEQWIKVVLVWIGFGTLVGLLATVIFPFRRPASPFWAVVAGIIGTTVGLLGLSWLYPGRQINPFNPLGFLAATIGAFALLMLYRLGCGLFGSPKKDADGP